jgi:hypothetical protein
MVDTTAIATITTAIIRENLPHMSFPSVLEQNQLALTANFRRR